MPYNERADKTVGSFCLRRVGSPSTLPTIGDVFSLNSGTTVVGRNPAKSDIFLDSAVHKALISRLHARITTQPGENKVTICDTSLNGTYVNDMKILDTEEIKVGDTVTFGHLKGAVLEPGIVARQHNSEFKFKLEKYHPQDVSPEYDNNNNSDDYVRDINGFLPDLSPFLNTTEEDGFSESQTIDKQYIPQLTDRSNKYTSSGSMVVQTNEAIHGECIDDSENDDDDVEIIKISGDTCNATGYINTYNSNKDTKGLVTNINTADAANIDAIQGDYNINVTKKSIVNKMNDVIKENRIVDNGQQLVSKTKKSLCASDLGDSECDNDELLAFAVAAQDCMDDDLSDSEMFSVDIASLRPKTVNSSSSNSSPLVNCQSEDKSPCRASFYFRQEKSPTKKQSPLTINAQDTPGNHSKSLKRSKRAKPKNTKSPKKTPSKEKNIPDTCGFKADCLRPHDRQELVEWVQCDYCKKWYHLECAGLTLDKVNNTAIKFNCGCVYTS